MTSRDFESNGFILTEPMFHESDLASARAASEELFRADSTAKAGLRDPLAKHPVFARMAQADVVQQLLRDLMHREAFVVRSILFDKTPDANWDVIWHQDITIAVQQRVDTPGFGPWSVKQGIPHVQPPAAVLERMVTVRIHLDDCLLDNGPLLVVPGSHANGFVNIKTLDTASCDRQAVPCCVSAGAAVVMKPLILHASRKSQSPNHRRVLHLEFASEELPKPLQWRSSR